MKNYIIITDHEEPNIGFYTSETSQELENYIDKTYNQNNIDGMTIYEVTNKYRTTTTTKIVQDNLLEEQ